MTGAIFDLKYLSYFLIMINFQNSGNHVASLFSILAE